ncbi:UNVERIFIED_CONTAM: LINE-1 reverse transcriptase [Sesamum latifolium]|uniref:LINE-1 reverse transcriptase n=1 Tax=Sesamum latifolium TaxID=2727402 RepID=A0AAW2WS74_9LAMI
MLARGSGLLGITVVGMPGACGSGWIESWSMIGGWSDGRTRIMKLRALKPVFRAQRQKWGDLSNNVKLAAGFLEAAQRLLEQLMLHQRAKIAWMKGGDQCSRIFFRKVAKRRSSKWVFQITDSDGQTLTSQPAVTNEFITFYQTLLGGSRRDCLIDLRYLRSWARHILSEEETHSLLLPVTADEIKQAVFDIDKTKAPGPDGYSSGFFKAAWPIVGREVNNPMVVAEFRPISCCNVLYKELFYGYNQQHLPPRCALKVDLRKAYDTIEWDFLRAVVILLGFPKKFIVWIVECVTTPSFWVCLNGSPHGYFRGARGLRQGDPMSPYLFVLVMEVLTLLLHQIIDQDGGFSYHWKCEEMQLCQLGFADDLLLFSKANTSSVHIFKHALAVFADLSGLRLIFTRAISFYLVRRAHYGIPYWPFWISRRVISSAVFGLTSPSIPTIYCGLPADSPEKSMAVFEVYWAMAFILPNHVIKEIEQRLRKFLWKGNTDVGGLMSRHLWRVIPADRSSIWVDWIFHYRLRDRSVWTVSDRTGSWGWQKLVPLFFSSPWDHNTRLYLILLYFAWLLWRETGTGHLSLTWRVLGSLIPFPLSMRAGLHYFWERLRFLGSVLFYGWLFLDDCPPWINPGCNTWALLVRYARMLFPKLMSTCSLHAPLRLIVCTRYEARFPFTGLTLLGQWSFSGPRLDGGESTSRFIIYGKNGIDVSSNTLRDCLLILLGLLFLRIGI